MQLYPSEVSFGVNIRYEFRAEEAREGEREKEKERGRERERKRQSEFWAINENWYVVGQELSDEYKSCTVQLQFRSEFCWSRVAVDTEA